MILDPGAVHVWFARTEPLVVPTRLHDCVLLLPAAERERWRRFGTWRGRCEYLLTRALVRTVLSRYADIDPRAWRFGSGRNGRPEITAPSPDVPLRFNVSHTTGLIVCAVTGTREVGVDVETWDRPRDAAALAGRFFSAEEADAVRAGAADAADALFVRLWTLKEAYVKARGLTLPPALRDVVFGLHADGGIRARFTGTVEDDPQAWQFALLRPTPRYCVAVAARCAAGERPLAIGLRRATIDIGDDDHDPDDR